MSYREKDDTRRKGFIEQIETIPPETMVYVDESGLDQECQREYGYPPKRQRLPVEVSGKGFVERHSIIAALLDGQAIAPWVFNGYCDTEVVLTWVQKVRVPELKPGLTLVMDNASFHKAPAIREAIEAAGCQLLFLPPYSTDLNPVAKRTGGHLNTSGLKSKPGYGKWPALSFQCSNGSMPSFRILINCEPDYKGVSNPVPMGHCF